MASVLPVGIKLVMLQAALNASGTYKVALFTSSFVTSTTTYSTTNEATNSAGTGYTAGGASLASVTTTTSGTTAFGDAADTQWTAISTSFQYIVVYDTGNANRIVAIYDTGGTQTTSNATLTVVWPTPDATNAMLRVA